MKKNLIAILIVALLVGVGTPTMAGDVLDNSGDWGHLILGMIVQEKLEDNKHEQRIKEEHAKQEQEAQRYERLGRHKQTVRPERQYSRNTMRRLFNVNDLIVEEVLEESYESTEFILDIHDDNNGNVNRTASDIKPFVDEYFEEAFDRNERYKMYELWVETKFTNWLEDHYE